MSASVPDCLSYESTHTQNNKWSYILYFITISKHPTLKGQCRLDVIKQITPTLYYCNNLANAIFSRSFLQSLVPSSESLILDPLSVDDWEILVGWYCIL